MNMKFELVGLKEAGDAAAIRDDIGRLIRIGNGEAFHCYHRCNPRRGVMST